jgi:heme exporter protein CcmD
VTYVVLAYALAIGVLGAYVASVALRRRAVEREIADLEAHEPEQTGPWAPW